MVPHRILPTKLQIELHSPWVRRLARAVVGDGHAAEDVVQDAWVRLAGEPPERPLAAGHLQALVRALAHRRRRGDDRRTLREERAARAEALPSTAEVAARVEVARRLAEALEQLDEPYRTTLVLRYFEDLSAAEIARRAGIPAGTVRARLKRGLDLLRARLDDGDGGRVNWMGALAGLIGADPRASSVRATAPAMATTATLLTMKLTIALSLCVLVALLAWTFVGRHGAGERALDTRAGEVATLTGSNLEAAMGFAGRREAHLDGAPIEVAAVGAPGRDGDSTAPDRVTIVARATTHDGRPIQSSRISLALAEQHEARGADDGHLELSLDRALLEQIAGVTELRSVVFWVVAPGFGSLNVATELVEGADRVVLGDVLLRPGGAVFGRVVDTAGLGVEGALVVFSAPHSSDRDATHLARHGPSDDVRVSLRGTRAPTTQSGVGGAFRIDGVPVGYGMAWAHTTASVWAYTDAVGVRAGEDIEVPDLVVHDAPEDVISGRVVDPEGRALPGVALQFYVAGKPGGWFSGRSASDGTFHYVPGKNVAQDIGARSPSGEWEHLKRTGVAPGTHGLELRFVHARWLDVVALDEAGRPVANGKAYGVPASGSTAFPLSRCDARLDGAGNARLHRPDVALRVRVAAPGYRDVLVGPFEPSTFPEPLVVTLKEVPALIGRVLLPDGRPAAGARVSLHMSASAPDDGSTHIGHFRHQTWGGDREPFVYDLSAIPTAAVRTDDAGRFRLPLPGVDARALEERGPEPEVYFTDQRDPSGSAARCLATVDRRQAWFVHAALQGQATVTSGPHVFDPTDDAVVDLELPLGGAVVGVVVLDGPGSTHGWTAYASDGRAEVARSEVAEDGTFRLEHLHSGPWQIRVFEPGKRFYPGGNMHAERVHEADVQVVAGSITEYEHPIHRLDRARLRGRIAIDGAAPGPLIVDLATSMQSTPAALDPDGCFEVALRAELKTRLTIMGRFRGTKLSITSEVELVPGDNDWSFEFTTASLECRVDPMGLPKSPRGQPTYVAERGPVTVLVTLESDEPGHYGPSVVPAGRGRLEGPRVGFDSPAPIWGELDLAAGELRMHDSRSAPATR